MNSIFQDLEAPSASATIAEVDGVFGKSFPSHSLAPSLAQFADHHHHHRGYIHAVSKGDKLPQSFKQRNHAPLVELAKFSPPYATRTRVRASVLWKPNLPCYTGPTWALVYYLDFPRMKIAEAFSAIQRIRSTPGDLIARYFFTQGASGGLALAEKYLSDNTWITTNQAALHKFLGMPTGASKQPSRSGDEKIEHIAFHPTMLVLAMSTTYARVHLFDLRTNKFLDYFLCAADDPADLVITALAFNSSNQLAVGMDTGCVDVWTVDLSGGGAQELLFSPAVGSSLGGRRLWPRFFDSKPSPGTQAILNKGRGGRRREKAAMDRVELVVDGVLGQRKLVGSVTAVSFSPSGAHLAIGTSTGGVWIYNLTMATSCRARMGSFSAASAKCTALSWTVSPGVRYVPLCRESGTARYQVETGDTVLVAGMDDGAVVYLPVRDSGASAIMLGSPVEFYPSRLALGAPRGVAVSHALVVPSPPGTSELYPPFPTLVVALADSPGIHIFHLVPESVLKASVPSAASVPVVVVPASDFRARSQRLCKEVGQLLMRSWYGVRDTTRAVHVGTLDTSSAVFLPKTAAPAGEYGGPSHFWQGYGGVVKSMAIDPTARRLIASFSASGDTRVEDSVVWFDASAIGAPTSVLGPLKVLRPQRVIYGDGCGGSSSVGEVRFAGGFSGGACAGMVTGGGKGVGILPAWLSKEEEEE